MDIGDKLDIMFSLLVEGIDEKMPHLINQLVSKKSRWPGKEIEDVRSRAASAEKTIRAAAEFDPTKTNKFTNFLVGQIKNGHIIRSKLQEDGPKIKAALEIFMNKKRGWPGSNDIMSYDNYRDLIKDASEYNEMLSKNAPETKSGKDRDRDRRAIEHDLRKNAKVVVKNDHDVVYEITDAETVALLGRGSQWCTSASPVRSVSNINDQDTLEIFKSYLDSDSLSFWPGGINQIKNDIEDSGVTGKYPNTYYLSALSTCKGYLERGPIYIIYRDGEPYMQLSGGEMMNIDDIPASRVGKQTAKTLIALVKTGRLNEYNLKPIVNLLKNSVIKPTLVR